MNYDSIICSNQSQLDTILQVRIKEDNDLLLSLFEIMEKEQIQSGVILSGIGALTCAVFRNLKAFPKVFPVKNEDRLFYKVEKPLELLSLAGWMARKRNGEPIVHAHFGASTVVGEEVVSIGGHLTDGTITGIKVVVAIALLKGDLIYAAEDSRSQSFDLFLEEG